MGPTPFYGARAEKTPFAIKQTNICRLSGYIKSPQFCHLRAFEKKRVPGITRNDAASELLYYVVSGDAHQLAFVQPSLKLGIYCYCYCHRCVLCYSG